MGADESQIYKCAIGAGVKQKEIILQIKSEGSQVENCWKRVCVLFYLGLQLIGRSPPTL